LKRAAENVKLAVFGKFQGFIITFCVNKTAYFTVDVNIFGQNFHFLPIPRQIRASNLRRPANPIFFYKIRNHRKKFSISVNQFTFVRLSAT